MTHNPWYMIFDVWYLLYELDMCVCIYRHHYMIYDIIWYTMIYDIQYNITTVLHASKLKHRWVSSCISTDPFAPCPVLWLHACVDGRSGNLRSSWKSGFVAFFWKRSFLQLNLPPLATENWWDWKTKFTFRIFLGPGNNFSKSVSFREGIFFWAVVKCWNDLGTLAPWKICRFF